MAEFFNALSAVLMLFCLMAVGYGLGLLGWMTASEKKFISRFVVNVAVPCNAIVENGKVVLELSMPKNETEDGRRSV